MAGEAHRERQAHAIHVVFWIGRGQFFSQGDRAVEMGLGVGRILVVQKGHAELFFGDGGIESGSGVGRTLAGDSREDVACIAEVFDPLEIIPQRGVEVAHAVVDQSKVSLGTYVDWVCLSRRRSDSEGSFSGA